MIGNYVLIAIFLLALFFAILVIYQTIRLKAIRRDYDRSKDKSRPGKPADIGGTPKIDSPEQSLRRDDGPKPDERRTDIPIESFIKSGEDKREHIDDGSSNTGTDSNFKRLRFKGL